jgi:putative membrane protein insertion efficiency factor
MQDETNHFSARPPAGTLAGTTVGALTKAVTRTVALLIRGYRYAISPLFGQHCRFHPSCSAYALAAIESHGLARGGLLALRRLGKCHPWHPGGFDPVPDDNVRKPLAIAADRGH